MKVLYIDDDVDDLEIFKEALQKIDKTVECDFAQGAREALFKLKSQRLPDLIFLDINMPEISGRQLLESLRSNPLLQHIPVVVYSTSENQKNWRASRALGAFAYIVKASNFKGICNQLEFIIKQYRQ
jgi:CheY-like chemotaxis protein